MATNVAGDLLDLGAKIEVAAAANMAAGTFMNMDGSLPSSAAACTGGVVPVDTASGDYVDLKLPPGIYRVRATGTVTAGLLVELLQASVYGNISGTKTAITAAGVQNISAGYAIGRAITGGVSGDTVLVNVTINQHAA